MADATLSTEDDVFSFPSAASKVYPLAPEGPHNVKVVRSLFEYKEPFTSGESKVPTVCLMLASDQAYVFDEQSGEKKNHNIFLNMKISDHRDATMTDFFRSVLGIEVPLSEKKTIVLSNRKQTTDEGKEQVVLPQFENLTFSVIIKHKPGKKDPTKMKDKVESFFATPDQKAANAASFRAAS